MKRIFYISILVFLINSSFTKEKNIQDVLIGKCWVNSERYSDNFVVRIGFNKDKHGLKFVDENKVILFIKDHWCGNATREKKIGNWELLNDSTISVAYLNYRESIVISEYRVRIKTNRKVEMTSLFYREIEQSARPKPYYL